MSQLLIKNAYLITMNADREVYETGSILIENNIIKMLVSLILIL